jgi:hypothetical protein
MMLLTFSATDMDVSLAYRFELDPPRFLAQETTATAQPAA